MRVTPLLLPLAMAACSTAPEPVPEAPAPAEPAQPATAEPDPPPSEDAWSPAVGGLRGRLLVERSSISGSERFEVSLELMNVGPTPLVVQADNPFCLEPSVEANGGAEVEPTSTRVDVLMAPRWLEVRPDDAVRFPVSIATEDGAAPAHLDFTVPVYRLEPGRYAVSARYASEPFEGTTDGTRWAGELMLPAIPLEVVAR